MRKVIVWLLPVLLSIDVCWAWNNYRTSCRCVPYYQCEKDAITARTAANNFGYGALSRQYYGRQQQETCNDYLSVCCPIDSILRKMDLYPDTQPNYNDERESGAVSFSFAGTPENFARLWEQSYRKKETKETAKSMLNVMARPFPFSFLPSNFFWTPAPREAASSGGNVYIGNMLQQIYFINNDKFIDHITTNPQTTTTSKPKPPIITTSTSTPNPIDTTTPIIDQRITTDQPIIEPPIITTQKPDDCICVHYYLCHENNGIITDGTGLLHPRSDWLSTNEKCADPLMKCCKLPNVKNTTNPSEQKKCGKRNANGIGNFTTDLENDDVKFGEFPWIVAIIKENKVKGSSKDMPFDDGYICSGSLVHPQIVLTEAHCVQDDMKNLKIRAGVWNTREKDATMPSQEKQVKYPIIHEQYDRFLLENDVAMLILEEPLDFSYENVGSICLPQVGDNFDLASCLTTRWTKVEDLYSLARLKRTDTWVMPHDDCETALKASNLGVNYKLHQSMICAPSEPSSHPCNADSGVPLVCEMKDQSNKYVQAGIFATREECTNDRVPGRFTNVAAVSSWIREKASIAGFNISEYQE